MQLVFMALFLTCVTLGSAQSAIVPQPPEIHIQVTGNKISANQTTLQLQLRREIKPTSIHAVLNGKDITSRLVPRTCQPETCLAADLLEADNLHTGKNVIYVTAQTTEGKLVTARQRFAQVETSLPATARVSRAQALAADDVVSYTPGFLPPTVLFETLYTGGWDGTSPWLQVGSQQYPVTSACPSGSIYLSLAFDRQTLDFVGGWCHSSGSDVVSRIKTFDSTRIVVVGTLHDESSDNQLDTSFIGGQDHTKDSHPPTGYIAIGVPGAAAGTAYENYAVDTKGDAYYNTPMWPFATGVVQEDPNGNYNFESTDIREYWVDPQGNDPVTNRNGSITVYYPDNTNNSGTPVTGRKYARPDSATARGGYWLLVFNRHDLSLVNPGANCAVFTPGSGPTDSNDHFINCGTIYNTGDADSYDNRTAAYNQLASDLSEIGPYQMGVLTTFGFPACCGSIWDVTGNNNWYDNNGTSNHYDTFRGIIESLGGSPRATLFWDFTNGGYHANPAYTFMMGSGMGDPLTGHAVVSASAYADQGQTGFVHGTLARNINGLYQPYQSSQQKDDDDDKTAGPDFTLTKLGAYPPVAWPELSGNKMNGADSVAGQEAAYHYISYTLITNYYIDGAAGNFLDDIHYFFTGSNSNYINYHYFNPINLPLPAPTSANNYCFAGPPDAPYSSPACFTQNDFTTVRQQVHVEVVYLTNVLNYMVSGPVNMKDIVATGGSNAGLALTSAAANILSANLSKATSSTPVKVNAGNVVGLLSGVVSVAAAVASGGDGAVAKDVNFSLSELGGLLTGSSAVLEGLKTPGQTSIPNRYGSFTTTIGQLANSNLQGNLAIGFDQMLDSILSDWGKLSTLGPKISDNRNPGYYSPNQVAQNAAVQLMTQASQRSFYMSLLPTLYQVHFWPDFFGVNPNLDFTGEPTYTNQPDMGSVQSHTTNNCAPFYMSGSNSNPGATAPPLGFVWMPSPANGYTLSQLPWNKAVNPFSPSDYYVIVSNQVNSKGTSQTNVPFMENSLAEYLFTSSGLNIPVDMFVNPGGPMQSQFQHMDNSTTIYNNLLGFDPGEVCSARDFTIARGNGVGGTDDPQPANTVTTTTLQVPATSVLGEDFLIQASVSDGSNPVTGGSVIFLRDQIEIANVQLDGNGAASFTVSNLALGAHTFQALYSRVRNYEASESEVATIKVYANGPELALSLSASSLSVSYGTTSTAVTLQTTSKSGSAGTVAFSCSGLPFGMTCNFNPAQTTIQDGGSVSTSLTVTSSAAAANRTPSNPTLPSALVAKAGMTGFLAIPLSLLCLLWVRKEYRRLEQFLCLALLLFSLGSLSACGGGSGGSSSSNPVREKGTKTILVNATCGSVTKSLPLVLNIQ
ncbi:MAG: Ig-like domain repeat protein [Acidobacteria bacterium]|nr:Ig-like domain repeat protein [Acidobacteriota bacterium]